MVPRRRILDPARRCSHPAVRRDGGQTSSQVAWTRSPAAAARRRFSTRRPAQPTAGVVSWRLVVGEVEQYRGSSPRRGSSRPRGLGDTCGKAPRCPVEAGRCRNRGDRPPGMSRCAGVAGFERPTAVPGSNCQHRSRSRCAGDQPGDQPAALVFRVWKSTAGRAEQTRPAVAGSHSVLPRPTASQDIPDRQARQSSRDGQLHGAVTAPANEQVSSPVTSSVTKVDVRRKRCRAGPASPGGVTVSRANPGASEARD